VSVSDAASAFASGSSPSNAIAVSDESDGVEVDDLDLDKMMDVNSAIAVEKEIAADTIGTLFAATNGHFFPFVEPCALELVALLPHYYEGIRKSATDSLLEIVRTFYDLSDHEEWQPGAVAVRCLHFMSSLINPCSDDPLELQRQRAHRSYLASTFRDVRDRGQQVSFVFLLLGKLCLP
jgi:importin-4